MVPPVEIDDAGGGNLVGGLVVGAYRQGRYASRTIPPDLFDGNGKTLAAIAAAVEDLVREFPREAEVHLCPSDLFDLAAARLTGGGRTVRRTAIESDLQGLVEADFLTHLRSLGLPAHVDRIGAMAGPGKDRAYRALNEFSANFVLADLPRRGAICKKSTRLWRRLSAADVRVEEVVLKGTGRRARLCHNCGRRLGPGPARRHVADRRTFYTHLDCGI